MKFSDHCADSIQLFGKPFEEVHRWLDEFAGSEGIGFRHRKIRHHQKGIEDARNLFGDAAAEAALRHIESDLREEGWDSGKDRMPVDEADYVRIGLF